MAGAIIGGVVSGVVSIVSQSLGQDKRERIDWGTTEVIKETNRSFAGW